MMMELKYHKATDNRGGMPGSRRMDWYRTSSFTANPSLRFGDSPNSYNNPGKRMKAL